jgi:hypothetical protein
MADATANDVQSMTAFYCVVREKCSTSFFKSHFLTGNAPREEQLVY